MRTNLIRGVLALAVVLAVAAPALAQSIVRGKVVDAQNKPVDGATVTIEATESNRKAETKTNRNGEFLQVGLQSGNYRVTVTKDKLTQTLPANVSQGRPVELEFQLSPTSGMTPEQAKAQQEMQAMAASAVAALNSGDNAGAAKQFQDIITKVPTCADCFINLGIAQMRLNQYTEAEGSFKKAAELRPESPDAFNQLASLYNAQKKFDLAAEASAKAASLAGGAASGAAGAEAAYNQGVILWNAGKFAEAKTQFEAAIAADPNNAMAHYQLGMANLNLGQIPEARKAFEGYLKADANGAKAAEVKAFLAQLPQ